MRIGRHPGIRALALAVASAAVIGCGSGDPNAISTVPAAGTVTYQGKPVESGTIQFVPSKGRPAQGTIKDGRFTLTTYDQDDGAIPGVHQVAVTSAKEVPRTGSEPEIVYIVPSTYASAENSGLAVEVPAAGSRDLKIEIK